MTSQSTASRIYRRMLPVINEALILTSIPIEQAASDGRTILIDGTYIPTSHRPAQGQDVTKANYSGTRRCQRVSIQVASTLTGQLLATSPHRFPELDTTPPPATSPTGHTSSQNTTPHGSQTPPTSPMTLSHPPQRRKDTNEPTTKNTTTQKYPASAPMSNTPSNTWKQRKILATGYRGRLTEIPDIIATITRLELYRIGW
ncbi:hypothetical protein KEM60_03046 [Austwickia sp. TVS 96-490-7B]|nr:hypothetical protein [Austwickia sp. TVS 96-490-7B]MBW3086817.1 hypothetical protein [Austwickia sp. TVS 96-490-7B]